jgi:hypothetical protein
MRVIATASIGISIPIRSQLLASGHHRESTRRELTGVSGKLGKCVTEAQANARV